MFSLLARDIRVKVQPGIYRPLTLITTYCELSLHFHTNEDFLDRIIAGDNETLRGSYNSTLCRTGLWQFSLRDQGLEHTISFHYCDKEEFILMCRLCIEQFYLDRK